MNFLEYFLCDIKPGNFIFFEIVTAPNGLLHRLSTPRLQYIDLQHMCCTKTTVIGKPYNACGTPYYSTLKLLYLEYMPLKDRTPLKLKAKDEYALFMSILHSVSTEFRQLYREQQLKLTEELVKAGDALEFNQPLTAKAAPFMNGILLQLSQKQTEQNILRSLVIALIKPQHLSLVFDFLADPYENPLPNTIGLYDVINWNVTLDSEIYNKARCIKKSHHSLDTRVPRFSPLLINFSSQ